MCLASKAIPKALWGFTDAANTNALLKKPFDRFHYGITNFKQLKRRKL